MGLDHAIGDLMDLIGIWGWLIVIAAAGVSHLYHNQRD